MKKRATRKTIRLVHEAREPPPAPLRFTPYAWAKLLFLRDAGDAEVGGFGISSVEDLLLVEDICLVAQTCSVASVKFDDSEVADFFDRQVDMGRLPEEFGRIWIHTHPGDSPTPSSTDETTFARCFGRADWSVMFILACGGKTYARLQLSVGPGADVLLPVEVDFGCTFDGTDPESWQAEYEALVTEERVFVPQKEPASKGGKKSADADLRLADPFDDPLRFNPWEVFDGCYF